jgi:trimethylamine--corrinoid protein Co-methyltransferase
LHGRADAVLDPEQGRRRAGLADVRAVVQLGQVFGSIHGVGQPFASLHDAPSAEVPLRCLEAALTLSDRPILIRLIDRQTTEAQLALVGAVLDNVSSAEGPYVLGEAVAAGSLRWDDPTTQALLTHARAGQAVLVRPSPAWDSETIEEAWARQHAEVLAAVALVQVVRPGTPAVHGGLVGGMTGPASAVSVDVGQNLARICDLPGHVDASPTASQVGAHAAAQAGWGFWPALLGGCALVSSAAGYLDGGLAFSFEQFLADVENLAMARHFLAGFEINDEALALDSIHAAGPGGHHLDTAHTRARYGDAFFASFMSDRLAYETWELAGSWDAARRAQALWPELLAAYEPPPLADADRLAIQETLARLRTRIIE